MRALCYPLQPRERSRCTLSLVTWFSAPQWPKQTPECWVGVTQKTCSYCSMEVCAVPASLGTPASADTAEYLKLFWRRRGSIVSPENTVLLFIDSWGIRKGARIAVFIREKRKRGEVPLLCSAESRPWPFPTLVSMGAKVQKVRKKIS